MLRDTTQVPQPIGTTATLPSMFPRAPEKLLRAFPDFGEYHAHQERLYKRIRETIRTAYDDVTLPLNALKEEAAHFASQDDLTASIAEEQSARIEGDAAIAESVTTLSAVVDTNFLTLEAAITEEATVRAEKDGYVESTYTLTATAGHVTTGMRLISAGGVTDLSAVIFQTDVFKIYNGTTGVDMFDLDSTRVRLGAVLTVDTAGGRLFTGAGNYDNADTSFYVSESAFSLGDKLTFTGGVLAVDGSGTFTGSISASSGTIGGFTIGSDYVRDTGNSFGMTSNGSGSVVRFWAGDTFANRTAAPYRVYADGTLFASAATIRGTLTSGVVVVGHPSQYVDSTSSNFQVVNASGSTNSVQNFCFGAGTPNFEGWVAGGSLGAETQTLSGRLMKIKLVTYGSGGSGWTNGGNASIWLTATEDHTSTARGTEIRFRTTAVGSTTEGYGLVIGSDGKLYIGPDNTLTRDTNLYRESSNTLATDDSFNVWGSSFYVNGNSRFDGTMRFGTHSALGGESVSGFITITDSGGVSRKLAVVS